MEFDLQVGGDPTGIRLARTSLRHWLQQIPEAAGVRNDAELVVSELLTNAITHGDSAPSLHAEISAARLRIEVGDHAPAVVPEMQPRRGSRGGYGLHIVEDLSSRWGWEATPTGKVVWADLML